MRRLLLLAGATVFVDTAFFNAITPLLPSYAAEYGLSKSGAGLLAASYPAGMMLGALPGGWFAARAGVRSAVLVGLWALAVASVAFAFAPTVELLILARFVQGLGSAASWAGALGWVSATAPRERRGQLVGSTFGAAFLGSLCGPVLGAVADGVGDEATFSAVGMTALVLAVVARATPGVPPAADARLGALLAGLRDGRIGTGAWIVMLAGLLFGTIGVLGPLRLDVLGLSAGVIAATFLSSAGLQAVVSPIMGRVSDRHGPMVPALAGLAGAAAVALLLPWPDVAWLMIALLILAAPAIGVLWLPAMGLLSAGAEARGIEQAVGFAVMNLAWAVGMTVGGAGGAGLAEATDDRVPYLLLAGLCGAGFLVLRARTVAMAASG
jgi:MFS family permease